MYPELALLDKSIASDQVITGVKRRISMKLHKENMNSRNSRLSLALVHGTVDL